MWPGYLRLFIRRPPEHDSGDEAVPEREAVIRPWGLINGLTKADGLAKAVKLSTFNARSETAPKSWMFRHAWASGRRCIIPAAAIFEPDHRQKTKGAFSTTHPIPTFFNRADGAPMGLAGLWDRYRDAAGQWHETYTMLMINADGDPLFKHYHAPAKEKRMVVILPEQAYDDWLTAPAENAGDFLVPYPSDRLVATPVPPKNEARNLSLF